ncbi:hypothetical protein [Clostridium intestinale]|uniref:Uncharacterized protein n=1 Tax=Clostridium intestinale TaxID=36845 RepID=A0A7D6ZJS1_9CLOT|nr:hypothetical protein [Clostridium intestinale]QLY82221.1 hypothetical protein HZF06_11720 [Clostridium intestinale]
MENKEVARVVELLKEDRTIETIFDIKEFRISKLCDISEKYNICVRDLLKYYEESLYK